MPSHCPADRSCVAKAMAGSLRRRKVKAIAARQCSAGAGDARRWRGAGPTGRYTRLATIIGGPGDLRVADGALWVAFARMEIGLLRRAWSGAWRT
jgi:hypothetical protein